MSLLLTCEHATHFIPDEYLTLFSESEAVLHSHQGWDPGALIIANYLKNFLHAPLYTTDASRLLVEVNRSLDHDQLFSPFTERLSGTEKETILNRFYFPYRNTVLKKIENSAKPVLHVSIHTFTPVWNGQTRAVDVGILFDPSRKLETGICRQLHQFLKDELPSWSIKDNEPYQGIDDGFTTFLRTKFPDEQYAGIEIEVNQKFSSDMLLPVSQALGRGISQLTNTDSSIGGSPQAHRGA